MIHTIIHNPTVSFLVRIGLVAAGTAAITMLAFSPAAKADTGPSPVDIMMMQQQRQMQQMQEQSQMQQQRQMRMSENRPFAWVDQGPNPFVALGQAAQFAGHGFAPGERVPVTLNGMQVAVVSADAGGNFSISTSAVFIPLRPYTYLFTGQMSGRVAQAVVIPR